MKKPMTVANRIRQRRKALNLSQDGLGRLVGVGQTTVAAWETGRNIPKPPMVAKLSKALGVPKEWLQFGETGDASQQVRLRGYVGAGELITMLPEDAIDWVPAPPDEEAETEALEVRGNSMWPVYRHGDLIYYERDRIADPARMVGEECIVEVQTGELLVKRLLPGGKSGTYTLASYNGPELSDRVVVSCSPILWVKRRRQR